MKNDPKPKKSFTITIAIYLFLFPFFASSAQNNVMMQAFYWDLPTDKINKNGNWWENLTRKSNELKKAGFTSIWVPCPAKGNWGIKDMGYGIYDHYDLGNYLQKGSVETRFGSRQELEDMISAMHQTPKIEVYADVVLNHVYSDEENEENNPAVKAYTFGEAHNGNNTAYPTNEIKWVIPNAEEGDYYIQIKGYNLDWEGNVGKRSYDIMIDWEGIENHDYMGWENEPNNGSGSFNIFGTSGKLLRAHIDYQGDIDEYKITLPATHDIVICLTARKEKASPWVWELGSQTNGYYPMAIWHKGHNLATTTLEARTNTHLVYPRHTGTGEENYTWNHVHFHPSDAEDWLGGPGSDEIITNTKFFGNDFNTFNPEVKNRLKEWGKWLASTVNFDGFRLDFVRGFQEDFAAEWVNSLPLLSGKQRFIVGEYWGADHRIKNWIETVAAKGADVTGFDFPLKNTLKEMCNGNQSDFNMAWLNHAGMIRNKNGNSLPSSSIVTFVENHDTGKEHDKWVTKDFKMAYAYILTHEGKPCIFYPHYYGVTQTDAHNPQHKITAPIKLKKDINKLMEIRKKYLGGTLAVLSKTGKPYPSQDTHNVYVARRQGNGIKGGAIIVLNNHDSAEKGLWVDSSPNGYENLAGKTLVNALDPSKKTQVQADGRAYFSSPARGYAIWIKESDLSESSTSTKIEVKENKSHTSLEIKSIPTKKIPEIKLNISEDSHVNICLIDINGRTVKVIEDKDRKARDHLITWESQRIKAGAYFCRASVKGEIITKKLIIR